MGIKVGEKIEWQKNGVAK